MRTTRLQSMVSRFLSWPLPKTVKVDPCALDAGYPHRSGTHLLTAHEAEQMLIHVLGTTWVDAGDSLNFGQALQAVTTGQRIYRTGWNGAGMWVEYYQPATSVDLPYLRLAYPVGSRLYPEGARVPWLPSQTDLLAQDWAIK